MSLNEYSTGSRGEDRGASEGPREVVRAVGSQSHIQSIFPKSGTVKISRAPCQESASEGGFLALHKKGCAKKCEHGNCQIRTFALPPPLWNLGWNRIESRVAPLRRDRSRRNHKWNIGANRSDNGSGSKASMGRGKWYCMRARRRRRRRPLSIGVGRSLGRLRVLARA